MINTLNLKLNIKNLFKRNLWHSPIIWTLCFILQIYLIYFCVCIIKPFEGSLLYLSTVGTIFLILMGLIFSEEQNFTCDNLKYTFIQKEKKELTKLKKINIKKYTLIIKYSLSLFFLLFFYHFFFNVFSLPALGCLIYFFYNYISFCKLFYSTANMHIDFTQNTIIIDNKQILFSELKELKIHYKKNEQEKIFIILKNNDEIQIVDPIGYGILILLLKKYGFTLNKIDEEQ